MTMVCALWLLPACSDEENTNGGDAGDGQVGDSLKQDGPSGDPCKPMKDDGASCGGGGTCAKNQICVNDGAAGAPVCRAICDPKGTNQCGGDLCGRLCSSLVDSTGKPLKDGACVAGWVAEGDPCGSGALCEQKNKMKCIGGTAAFCRRTCTDAKDCKGYKVSCLAVTGQTYKVCAPGAATNGPKEGGDCSKADVYCVSGLLCDPATKKCIKLCTNLVSSSSDAGSTNPCGAGSTKVCKKVVDTAASITLGWACQAGSTTDGGTKDGGTKDAKTSDAKTTDTKATDSKAGDSSKGG